MPRFLSALPLLVLPLPVACGAEAAPGQHATSSGTLTVKAKILTDPDGPRFTEGAVPEIRLVSKTGHVIKPARDHRSPAVFADLAPGHYRLKAALRPCDGNCGVLDPPMLRCSARVTVDGDGSARVVWQGIHACHATVGRAVSTSGQG